MGPGGSLRQGGRAARTLLQDGPGGSERPIELVAGTGRSEGKRSDWESKGGGPDARELLGSSWKWLQAVTLILGHFGGLSWHRGSCIAQVPVDRVDDPGQVCWKIHSIAAIFHGLKAS